MLKLPKLVMESAQRIAESNGVSVDAVINRYVAASKKTFVSADDFFWNKGDISPVRKRGSRESRNAGRAALSKVARGGKKKGLMK